MLKIRFPILLFLVVILISGCGSGLPVQEYKDRPSCVTLENYNYAINSIMQMDPDWDLVKITESGNQEYEWKMESAEGYHSLKATVTPGGCVCATNATSDYKSGFEQGQLAGYFQGAAVAPISTLGYISSWLEPRLTWACSLAFIFHQQFTDGASMEDGTDWKLMCSRSDETRGTNLYINLEIATHICGSN